MRMTQQMTQEMRVKLKGLVITHEDEKLMPYLDTCNPPNVSIGIGRNITGRGIFADESNLMFENDSNYFHNFLYEQFEWYQNLNEARQCALIDMCFMGTKKFLEFHNMISYLKEGNFEEAAKEIINSQYEKEVHQRAHDLANIIRTGVL
jgi:lysozyme